MFTCQHNTSEVILANEHMTVSRCTWGCDELLFSVRLNRSGLEKEFTGRELVEFVKAKEGSGALQPCGHEARYIFGSDEGTHYCVMCEMEVVRARLSEYEKKLNSYKWLCDRYREQDAHWQEMIDRLAKADAQKRQLLLRVRKSTVLTVAETLALQNDIDVALEDGEEQ